MLAFADQPPLTSSMLTSASPQEQIQMFIGRNIFQSICPESPEAAGIINGILLEFDTAELMRMVQNSETVIAEVSEFETNFEMYC